MSDDPNNDYEQSLNDRLKSLEESENRSRGRNRPNVSTPVAIVGIVAIVMLGGMIYLSIQPDREQEIATGLPAEFQPAGDGFGDIEPPSRPEPEPEPAPDPNEALLERIEALQAEIDRLRNAPEPEADTSEQDAKLEELLANLAALQEANEQAQENFRRELRERDQQLRKLQSELDLARLQPPEPPQEPGMSEEERRRLAELERRRQAAAEFQEKRITSGILAFGSNSSGPKETTERLLDAGTDFVRSGAERAEVTQAAVIANPSNTVTQGTLIQAALETAVDSSLPGQVRAITSENVYAYDGTRVLIARGSRLIGRYDSSVELAQERITIAWDRIILPTKQTVEISAFGGDGLGRSGVTGDVDSRFTQRFGAAALISIISAGAQYGSAQIVDDDGGLTGNLGGGLESASDSALNEYLSLGPIIHVDQGAPVTVMVDRDLEIF